MLSILGGLLALPIARWLATTSSRARRHDLSSVSLDVPCARPAVMARLPRHQRHRRARAGLDRRGPHPVQATAGNAPVAARCGAVVVPQVCLSRRCCSSPAWCARCRTELSHPADKAGRAARFRAAARGAVNEHARRTRGVLRRSRRRSPAARERASLAASRRRQLTMTCRAYAADDERGLLRVRVQA